MQSMNTNNNKKNHSRFKSMESNIVALSDVAYMIIDIPTHVYPILGFLSELEAQGINFDIYGPKNIIKNVLRNRGQNRFGFEELSWNNGDIPKFFETIYQSFLKTLPEIEAIWKNKNKKPKLIIADMFAHFAKLLAKRHGIPLLVFYSNYFALQFSDKHTRDRVYYEIENQRRDESQLPLQKEVEKRYNITIESVRDIFFEGDRNISCLPAFLGDPITFKNDKLSYIGPAFRDENKSERHDIDLDFIQANAPLIYVSLGTCAPNIAGFSFYETIIDALGDTEHKVLISVTLGKAEELIARGLPKNIIVKSWVPQMRVLEHSKLFVSHVGAGGLMEAMLNGVPIIAVPNFGDQPINAEMVERLNVGRQIKDKSVEGVKKIVEEVLQDEGIRESCEKYKKMIDPMASKRKFLEIVKSMIK